MKKYLSLIKFSHTIFAMPFALLGFTLASQKYGFSIEKLIYVILCMIFARSAAMAFNRYLDRDIDKVNPRTLIREIPSGIIKSKNALIFTYISALLFILSSYMLNNLCFVLSPIALLVILGYSYTKRFTSLCHIVLGIGLGLAPIGAYIAVSGSFHLIPVLIGLAVLCWVAGFDIIYALQDEEFDKSNGLFSIPASIGKKNALFVSTFLHVICMILLFWSIRLIQSEYPSSGVMLWISFGIFTFLLWYQHTLVTSTNLSKVNMAFFTTNGIASLLFGLLSIIDLIF
ncbi:MAG: putative 4-hydroxybenzoate polyprenyltransferase [Saprospiraceae bacterium]|nr:putative 4-hydroxybenzoate polyprenyltransferase [Saprospiraceae bacterium]MCB9308731.1 UbiA family prenyltransferase [Lewinellaceae bacterium]